MTEDLKHDLTKRDQLRETARYSKRLEDWASYRTQRNKCVKLVKSVKIEYYNQLYRNIEAEKDTKKLFKLTGELLNDKQGTLPQGFLTAGKLTRKPKEMANLQLDFYNKKINKLIEKIPKSNRNPLRYLEKAMDNWEQRDTRPIFKFREVTLQETVALINSLGNSEAFGHDSIDAQAIKTVATEISQQIKHLINTSLMMNKFANKWKFSKVTPRLKSKDLDRHNVSSYRPVAVLSTISKLVERAAQQQLLKFLEDMNQLNASNHAYRRNMSMTTTLAEILDEIYQGVEEKKISSLMAVDQSAAFDCIEHPILLNKLDKYNIGQDAKSWIANYLSYRTQYVVIGSGQSRMTPTTRGVPQGSVIGPLLYAIFTNETSEVIKTPGCRNLAHADRRNLFGNQCSDCGILTTYADDTTYAVANKDRIEKSIQNKEKPG